MTTTPGALPLPAIRQAALDLMKVRSVVAVTLTTSRGDVLIYAQDVSDSDELACKVLRALGQS